MTEMPQMLHGAARKISTMAACAGRGGRRSAAGSASGARVRSVSAPPPAPPHAPPPAPPPLETWREGDAGGGPGVRPNGHADPGGGGKRSEGGGEEGERGRGKGGGRRSGGEAGLRTAVFLEFLRGKPAREPFSRF